MLKVLGFGDLSRVTFYSKWCKLIHTFCLYWWGTHSFTATSTLKRAFPRLHNLSTSLPVDSWQFITLVKNNDHKLFATRSLLEKYFILIKEKAGIRLDIRKKALLLIGLRILGPPMKFLQPCVVSTGWSKLSRGYFKYILIKTWNELVHGTRCPKLGTPASESSWQEMVIPRVQEAVTYFFHFTSLSINHLLSQKLCLISCDLTLHESDNVTCKPFNTLAVLASAAPCGNSLRGALSLSCTLTEEDLHPFAPPSLHRTFYFLYKLSKRREEEGVERD